MLHYSVESKSIEHHITYEKTAISNDLPQNYKYNPNDEGEMDEVGERRRPYSYMPQCETA